jgi:glycosyltransferase involved in cell wall biosynthesis
MIGDRLKILWHSATPLANSGYGKVTRAIVERLCKAGHHVAIGTKHDYYSSHSWRGVEVFAGKDIAYCNQYIEQEKLDYVISLWDIWLLLDKRKFPKEKWVAYIPIDTENMSEALRLVAAETGTQIALSQHGRRAMREAGFDPLYAPHGVDMNKFRPKPEGRAAFRDFFKFDDDIFLIGSVGINYADDRKGFIPLMRAFKTFHERHANARLYLHTSMGAGAKGNNDIAYWTVAKNLGIDEWVKYPCQMSYSLGRIHEDWLCDIYNGFDVFCLPTRGEGFGLCTVDAQACGIPVIVSDNTTGPELCKSGWLIECRDDDLRWLSNNAWRYDPAPGPTLEALEKAYAAWESGEWPALKEKARQDILCYDWDAVWPTYWEPIIKGLEERLGGN